MSASQTFTCVQCGHLLPATHRSHRKHKGSWVCRTCAEIALENAKGEAERDAQRAAVASQATRSARSRLEERMAESVCAKHLSEVWE